MPQFLIRGLAAHSVMVKDGSLLVDRATFYYLTKVDSDHAADLITKPLLAILVVELALTLTLYR